MEPGRQRVSVRDLFSIDQVTGLTVQHLPVADQSVREIALITDVDRILDLPPDSVVILGDELALGGWVISVALRYAWERHAVALVVSQQTFSPTVIELAQRFNVALFTTSDGVDATALMLARKLGALEAGALKRLDALYERIVEADSVLTVVDELSLQLDRGLVQVEVMGIPSVSVGQRPSECVEVHVPMRVGKTHQRLSAYVTRALHGGAQQALAKAAPSVRALLVEQELAAIAAAAPLLTFAAVAGLSERSVFDRDQTCVPSELQLWADDSPLVAIALQMHGENGDGADRIAPLVTYRWQKAFAGVPIARVESGWFAFVPLTQSFLHMEDSLSALSREVFGPLGIAVGMSADPDGAESAHVLLRRAWLAARLAEADGIPVDSRMTQPMLMGRLLPPADAREFVQVAFPLLLSEANAQEIVVAVRSFLDAAGSVSAAARKLGIHRNTVQARLSRAASLSIDLTDPGKVLSTHLLLNALDLDSLHPPAVNDK